MLAISAIWNQSYVHVSKTCSVRPYSTKKSNKFYNNVGINCYPHFTSYTTSPAPICTSVHEIKWNQWSYKQIGLRIVLQFSFWEFFNEISFYSSVYLKHYLCWLVCINCVFIHTYDGLININSTSRNNCKHKECVGKLCFMIIIRHLTTAVVHWWKPSSSNNFWNDWNIDIILVIF